LLLANDYRVIGVTRDKSRAETRLPVHRREQFELIAWDAQDQKKLPSILKAFQPDEVYNFAAFSSGAGMFENPLAIGEVNGLAVTSILEAIRVHCPKTRICQASSSEMFGRPLTSPQTESTPFLPRSPYGAAKLYAHTMIDIYRHHFGLFACSAILFNHESPRRGFGFVTRKVTHAVASIKLGRQDGITVGSLQSRRDWGFAGDSVRAMWMMLQADRPDDFVVATGQTHSVEDLCRCAFDCVGLDYRQYVREDPTLFRAREPVQLVGDSAKAMVDLGWQPQKTFEEMIQEMVQADLANLSAQAS
jgi:GDPmannose 4,6-dehydratase